MTGNMEVERYLELWREAERNALWTITSPPKTRGADLVERELTLRLGTKTHVLQWNDGAPISEGIRLASEFGRRIVAAAREVTTER